MYKILETYRKKKQISIKDIAQKLKVDPSLMSRILSGKRKPTKEQVLQLSDFLDINKKEILQEYLLLQINEVLEPYPELATEVIGIAEERVAYLNSGSKFKTIPLHSELKDKLKKIDQLHEEWNSKKPLDSTQLAKMNEFFQTQYTYESNKIEGNTLTLQETHLVVNEGITIGGKSMQEHLEAINHQHAIELIIDFVQNKIAFNRNRLLQMHQLILTQIDDKNAGQYRNVQVRIAGSKHVPPEPFLIDKMMEDYFIFYDAKKEDLHPVLLAAEMHERLVTIHPFVDGNGRTSRLVMNLILQSNGYPICNLKGDLDARMRYYQALEQVQLNHEKEDFYNLVMDGVIESLESHLELT